MNVGVGGQVVEVSDRHINCTVEDYLAGISCLRRRGHAGDDFSEEGAMARILTAGCFSMGRDVITTKQGR